MDFIARKLPLTLTSFIGRDRELEAVTRLLGTARLLMLTGPGGVGKTRLALAAIDRMDAPAGGIRLVELASLSDPGLVPHTVASALDVREEPGRTVVESVVAGIGRQPLLLVLDNCEHLTAAVAYLTEALLRGCPAARILATSRQPLGITGETVYRVPSLSLPDPETRPRWDAAARSDAVRLFADRAALIHPSFALTETNTPVVVQVCRRLDGIPLAIELAVARMSALSVDQIAARLDDRFRLLTGGSRTSLPRHQTLRAAIDWSHDLLSPGERALFRRVSVFAGTFTLEAVEAVCAGDGVALPEVLDLLTQLVDKSLILAEPSDARYQMQETVRRYARDRLLESGEQTALLVRHREWCLRLAESAEPELQGPDQKPWMRRLALEHDNMRDALAFSLEAPGDAALRLAAALWWFWHARGYLNEGRAWLTRALAAAADAPPSTRARGLYAAGFLAWRLGAYDQAVALGEESLAVARAGGDRLRMASAISLLEQIARARGDSAGAAALAEDNLALFRDLDDSWGIATTLIMVGNAAQDAGDHVRARAALEESLGRFNTMGDAAGTATALHFLGLVARDQGDLARAQAAAEESLRLNRELGEHSRSAFALHLLGLVARDRGDHAEADRLFGESLAMFRDLEDTWGITTALVSLGTVARLRGDGARAAALLRESLALRRTLGDRAGIAECLDHLAGLALQHGRAEQTARLLGAADVIREATGARMPAAHRTEREHTAAATRRRLGASTFAAARSAGRRMTLDEAVADAVAPWTDGGPGGGTPSTGASPAPPARESIPGELTAREQEVARLVAEGRTNREIAGTLYITEGTAANHVQHILNKLGLRSRAQIAAWAAGLERGRDAG